MNYLDNRNNYYPVVDKKENGIVHLGLIPNYIITVSESNPLTSRGTSASPSLNENINWSLFQH